MSLPVTTDFRGEMILLGTGTSVGVPTILVEQAGQGDRAHSPGHLAAEGASGLRIVRKGGHEVFTVKKGTRCY